MSKKKMTGAEIMDQDAKEAIATVKAWMKDAEPKTPLEAAIDRATGFKPEDMLNVARETEQGDSETEQGDSETEQGDSETEQGDSETEKAETGTEKPEAGTEKPETGTEKRDWVGEAVQCFIKDAQDLDPTDPISAIASYFAKNATPELKARCEKEGKNATGCWRFIEAVARKALHGSSGHIDPGVVYAIAMHWFEDVPKDWDKVAKAERSDTAKPKKSTSKKIEKLEDKIAQGRVSVARKKELRKELAEAKRKDRAKAAKKPAETPSEIKKEKARAKTKAKKLKSRQAFFFEMLETPVTTPEKNGGAR